MSTADLKRTLDRNQREATDLTQRVGPARVRILLKRAEADLVRRLHQAEGLSGPGKASFTSAQLRVTLAHVRDVTTKLGLGVKRVLVAQAGQAAEQSSTSLLRYLGKAEREFAGVGRMPLALREAAVLDSARDGAQSSLLRRIATSGEDEEGVEDEPHRGKPGVLQRYGTSVVGLFEEELQQGLVTRAPWATIRASLVEKSPFLQQAPAFWAERIVRTETMGALNRAGLEGIRAVDEQVGGMVKILSAVFDDRTGADSYAVHGQIRMLEQPFDTWFGQMQHPPDRPNDRGTVVPHRKSWPIPPFLAWKDAGQIADRWRYEGRKGSPPERPVMTTVPLAEFGRPVERDRDE